MTDPIAALARWLAEHVEWLRHREFVDEAYWDFASGRGHASYRIKKERVNHGGEADLPG